MIFRDPTRVNVAWNTALQRVGGDLATDPSLAKAELSADYGALTDEDHDEIERVLKVVKAGAYDAISDAPDRDVAAQRIVDRIGVSPKRAEEIVAALAPSTLRHAARPATTMPVVPSPRRRRGTVGWLIALLSLLLLAAGAAATWMTLRDRQARRDVDSLTSEVERLTKQEAALRVAQAKVDELTKQVGAAGANGAAGTGLTGQLAAAKTQLSAAQTALQDAKSALAASQDQVKSLSTQLATASSGTAPAISQDASAIGPKPGAFAASLKAGTTCSSSTKCDVPASVDAAAKLSSSKPGSISLSIDGMLSTTVAQTLGGTWAGTADLKGSYQPSCNGTSTPATVNIVLLPATYQADPATNDIVIAAYRIVLSEDSAKPACPGAQVQYSGEITSSS